ncbi:hypothetical protein B0A48_06871 [Cryoendolithus antarcticus]|uniref:F-box domain-containing protein n=1 Tax=Cryoendolithus antarcticus TaxID=1507870 RepID=A0A1V8T9J0_9PEZI|nr:hypothetical protein B0A48_06871 [Cryoendolithus antarcticus]
MSPMPSLAATDSCTEALSKSAMLNSPADVSGSMLVANRSAATGRDARNDGSEVATVYSTAPSGGSRRSRRILSSDDNDEELIDTTAALTLRSKKTLRIAKRRTKPKKTIARPVVASFLELPSELLQEVFSHLAVADIHRLARTSRDLRDFILENESSIARDIISLRYPILAKCFPLPVTFDKLPPEHHEALLSPAHQSRLLLSLKPYAQHVPPPSPRTICSCVSCTFAWINLAIVTDLAHWQTNLNTREPIPMIKRGEQPEWNVDLLAQTKRTLERTLTSPLVYATILERHLHTTSSTILRRSLFTKVRPVLPEHRPYFLSHSEVLTDAFLERKGRDDFEPPFHRDNYYNIEAYVPNRKWSKTEERWIYFAQGQHDRDLEWARARFEWEGREGYKEEMERMGKYLRGKLAR